MASDDDSSLKPRAGHVTVTLDVGRPLIVVLWAMFVFLMGGITGGSLSILLRPPPPPHYGPPGERLSAGLPRDFAQVMQRDHGLTDEQTTEIEKIVSKYQPLFEKTSSDARAQLRADLEKMNGEILPLLTEQQRREHLARWRNVVEQSDRGGGPPPHGPPPHGPPPPRR